MKPYFANAKVDISLHNHNFNFFKMAKVGLRIDYDGVKQAGRSCILTFPGKFSEFENSSGFIPLHLIVTVELE